MQELLKQSNVEWEPSLEEYDPQISAKVWKELLGNKKVFNEKSLTAMSRILVLGGIATCTQLADRFGKTYRSYNCVFTALAKRVWQETNCLMPPKRANGTVRYLAVLFVMRKVKGNDGVWELKLREELREALLGSGFPFKEDIKVLEK